MDTMFWDLFWTTGMPEAWLMSRDRNTFPSSGVVQGGGQVQLGPLADFPAPLLGNVPGNPRNLY